MTLPLSVDQQLFWRLSGLCVQPSTNLLRLADGSMRPTNMIVSAVASYLARLCGTYTNFRQIASDLCKHLLEHNFGQPPGLGIVAAAVIAVVQDEPVWHFMPYPMLKAKFAWFRPERKQDGLMSNIAQCQHD